MKLSAYSVGISDLIANYATQEKISKVITDKKKEVHNLIDPRNQLYAYPCFHSL